MLAWGPCTGARGDAAPHRERGAVSPGSEGPGRLQSETLTRPSGTHALTFRSALAAQAPTPEIKAAWVSEIRKVLTSQLQACRGEGAASGLSPGGPFMSRNASWGSLAT